MTVAIVHTTSTTSSTTFATVWMALATADTIDVTQQNQHPSSSVTSGCVPRRTTGYCQAS